MDIITQAEIEKQDLMGKILRDVPVVLTGANNEAYLLIKDPPTETEAYIEGFIGRPEELRVLPEETERAIIRRCALFGCTYSYRSQAVEYMHRVVRIKYLRITNPKTGVSLSPIPWFMLPGRPYPVFLYLYACRHYGGSDKKSMELSSKAAGKLFGVPGFSKSTLSRNLKAMAPVFAGFDRPLSVREAGLPSTAAVIDRIPEILRDFKSAESMARGIGTNPCRLPDPVRGDAVLTSALSQIPAGLSGVINARGSAGKKESDNRKRPKRRRGGGNKRVQRQINFVGSRRLEEIRRAFIAISRSLALDAATEFHRFLG